MVEDIFADVCCPEKRGINTQVLEEILYLAVEIVARAGKDERLVRCSPLVTKPRSWRIRDRWC